MSDEDNSGPSHDSWLPAILVLALVLSVLFEPDAAAQPPPGETVAAQPAAIAENPTPTNAPATPALRCLGGPYTFPGPTGAMRTAFYYALTAPTGTTIRLWTDAARVVLVNGGWTTWRNDDAYLTITATGQPETDLHSFAVILDGEHAGAAIRWEALDAGVNDMVWGAAATPRTLPSTGRLYLPAVLR